MLSALSGPSMTVSQAEAITQCLREIWKDAAAAVHLKHCVVKCSGHGSLFKRPPSLFRSALGTGGGGSASRWIMSTAEVTGSVTPTEASRGADGLLY